MRVGPYTLVSVVDASGVLATTGRQAFPSATDQDWEAARRLDPQAFGPDGRWALDFRCVAIRRPTGRVMLVDVGIGGEGSPAQWAPLPGRLVEALDEAGIRVGDVDTVVLTHLHEDHCGGVVDGAGRPVFGDARHVVQAAEVAAVRGDTTIWTYAVEPLSGAGLLDEVDGSVELYTGIAVFPTPGHTVGHQSVVVAADDDDDEVVVTGDVLVHAVQLANPDVAYISEADQAVAVDTRRRLLVAARTGRARLATAHLHTAFVTP